MASNLRTGVMRAFRSDMVRILCTATWKSQRSGYCSFLMIYPQSLEKVGVLLDSSKTDL